MNLEWLKKITSKVDLNNSRNLKIFSFLKIKFTNKEKLKLGSIIFEIKEITFAGFKIFENFEMRYINQDTTREDSLRIDNKLNSLKWKSDFNNIFALLIIFVIFFTYFYSYIHFWFDETFYFLKENNDNILKDFLKESFSNNLLSSSKLNRFNRFLNSTLIDSFNFIFFK